MERLEALLGLLTLQIRVVLVADDLEGFSADESAALRLAAFLGALRQSVDRLDVILSLNQDIWESAFLPRLSGGLADRLSEVVVELEPLKEAEMEALLDSRVPGLGRRVLDHIDVGSAGRHARGLIRAAGMAWLKATAMDAAPPVAAAVEVPAPAKQADSWPAPEFAPVAPVAIPAEPLSYQPPVDSPFQAQVEPAAPAPEPVIFQPPVDAPFQTPRPAFVPQPAAVVPSTPEPVPEPVLPPVAEPAVAAPSATAADTDRVDDLLRQFRERYGRGSL
jgi:hypothetical protein